MNTPPKPHDICLPASGHSLGMMGDGQLGRMFCQAAQSMGFSVTVYGQDPQGPAAQIAQHYIDADYDDEAALQALAERSRYITTEFENIPAHSLKRLSQRCRTAPCAAAVAVAQNRITEKAFIAALDIDVTPYRAIRQERDLHDVPADFFPAILKTASFGYDGKGQQTVHNVQDALAAYEQLGKVDCVLEARLELQREVSVVLARAQDGAVECFPMGVNHHINGILSSTIVLAHPISESLQTTAQAYAKRIAAALNYVGVLCVEFFVLQHGRLVANEIATRPHNSGHYTMDACKTSQFEQQVRALAGLPLGRPDLLSPAIMLNLLGDCWYRHGEEAASPAWDRVLALPGVHLHLYGKLEPRRGRKMGHINVTAQEVPALFDTAREVSRLLDLGAELDGHEA